MRGYHAYSSAWVREHGNLVFHMGKPCEPRRQGYNIFFFGEFSGSLWPGATASSLIQIHILVHESSAIGLVIVKILLAPGHKESENKVTHRVYDKGMGGD